MREIFFQPGLEYSPIFELKKPNAVGIYIEIDPSYTFYARLIEAYKNLERIGRELNISNIRIKQRPNSINIEGKLQLTTPDISEDTFLIEIENFTVEQGKLTLIIGPNNSGKTYILAHIAMVLALCQETKYTIILCDKLDNIRIHKILQMIDDSAKLKIGLAKLNEILERIGNQSYIEDEKFWNSLYQAIRQEFIIRITNYENTEVIEIPQEIFEYLKNLNDYELWTILELLSNQPSDIISLFSTMPLSSDKLILVVDTLHPTDISRIEGIITHTPIAIVGSMHDIPLDILKNARNNIILYELTIDDANRRIRKIHSPPEKLLPEKAKKQVEKELDTLSINKLPIPNIPYYKIPPRIKYQIATAIAKMGLPYDEMMVINEVLSLASNTIPHNKFPGITELISNILYHQSGENENLPQPREEIFVQVAIDENWNLLITLTSGNQKITSMAEKGQLFYLPDPYLPEILLHLAIAKAYNIIPPTEEKREPIFPEISQFTTVPKNSRIFYFGRTPDLQTSFGDHYADILEIINPALQLIKTAKEDSNTLYIIVIDWYPHTNLTKIQAIIEKFKQLLVNTNNIILIFPQSVIDMI